MTGAELIIIFLLGVVILLLLGGSNEGMEIIMGGLLLFCVIALVVMIPLAISWVSQNFWPMFWHGVLSLGLLIILFIIYAGANEAFWRITGKTLPGWDYSQVGKIKEGGI